MKLRNYSLLAALFSLALCASAEWSAPLVRVAGVEYHVPEPSYTIDDYTSGYWAMWDRTGFTATNWCNYGGAMDMSMQGEGAIRTGGIGYVETGTTSKSTYCYGFGAEAVNELFRGVGFTAEACFRFKDAPVAGIVVARDWGVNAQRGDGHNGRSFAFEYVADGLGIFLDRDYDERSTTNAVIPAESFEANTLYTVAVTRYGTNCVYYLNGEAVGTFDVGGRIGSSYLYVGKNSGSDVRHRVQRYYPRALTAAEVRRNWLVDQHRYGEASE